MNKWTIAAALSTAGVAGYWLGWRQSPLDPPQIAPAHAYADAVARIAAQSRNEIDTAIPPCRTQLLTHGQRTGRAVLLLHGFTNCPAQFAALGAEFFNRGDNVVIARLPRHGHPHSTAHELAQMNADQLLASASAAVDIACGLGDNVVVMGLSLGGILTGWMAQLRSDIARAVLVSPALAFYTIPTRWQPVYARVLSWWPSYFYWWDPVARDQGAGPAHAYPGFYSSAFAQVLRLGLLLQRAAQRTPPRAGSIVIVTNPTDEAVDNRGAAALVRSWRRHGAAIVERAFPAEWRLPHDLIDPAQPDQQVERVYPLLVQWAGE